VTNASDRPLTICAIGSGTSTHVATRLRWFAERGHRVFLLTAAPSASGIQGVVEIDLNAEVERVREVVLRIPRPLRGVVHRAVRGLALQRTLRRCRPDVVHVHYAYSYYAWMAGLLGCRPLVVTVYGGDVLFDEQGATSPAGRRSTVRLLRGADYITTQSHFLSSAVGQLGDFRAKTERVLWGVALDEFRRRDTSALRRGLALKPEARVILSPKILQPFYRIHLVVEAMTLVRRRCPNAVLMLSEYEADPAYRQQLAGRIAELELDEHVRFAGVVPDGAMPAYYSLAELSIAIPPSDGLPQALLESMACETPQILSRLPRYEEIVRHEESAYFVDPDPGSIAAGIVRLLEDETLRSRIATQGRRIVEEEADLDEQAARVESRLRELVDATRPRTFRLSALLSAASIRWRTT
jgi:glycosyltransferase involved in cell wall biosynthesis